MKTTESPISKLEFTNEEFVEEQNLDEVFSTIDEVLSLNVMKNINIKSYFDSTIKTLLEDLRFQYRIFRLIAFETGEFYGFADRISIINLAILSIINDIEYRNPIDILIEKGDNSYKISYEVIVKEKTVLDWKGATELYPKVEGIASYIKCVCNQDGNVCQMSISERKLRIELVINAQPTIGASLACDPFGNNEKELISKYIDVFFKPIENTDIEEEELE